MWTDEIFIDALTDALIQRTRPALYDQLDVVTTATDQRLKVKSTAAIREWAASAVSCLLCHALPGAHWIVRILRIRIRNRKMNPKIPL
jgi:hypothetical protein